MEASKAGPFEREVRRHGETLQICEDKQGDIPNKGFERLHIDKKAAYKKQQQNFTESKPGRKFQEFVSRFGNRFANC